MATKIQTIEQAVKDVGIVGKSLISINDLSDTQLYKLFELAKMLEPWNRSGLDLMKGQNLITFFFQPSTRTRMSFETAMQRLGGTVVSEPTPMMSSASAKEESLNDSMRVMSQYANVIVLRHFDADAATEASKYSDCPVINGGWGHREHPTQALLDLYTLWRTFGHVKGLKVAVTSPDLVKARTGHSMAQGLARLGAKLYLVSRKDLRTPEPVMKKIQALSSDVEEVFDLEQDGFNKFAADMDMIYLPGCSAPAGADSEAFKKIMDDYYLRYETVMDSFEKGKGLYVTHTLPRRDGEMDLRIDNCPGELMFKGLAYSVSLRAALIAAIVGV